MARRPNRTEPIHWHNVVSGDRPRIIGRYAIDGSTIVVVSPKGWTKATGISASAANEAIARTMLTEAPPGWR